MQRESSSGEAEAGKSKEKEVVMPTRCYSTEQQLSNNDEKQSEPALL